MLKLVHRLNNEIMNKKQCTFFFEIDFILIHQSVVRLPYKKASIINSFSYFEKLKLPNKTINGEYEQKLNDKDEEKRQISNR